VWYYLEKSSVDFLFFRGIITHTKEHGMNEQTGGTVIVVDDEVKLAEAMKKYLQSKGFQAEMFVDSRKALAAIVAGSIQADVLVSNYAMPSMDGMELISEARAIRPGMKAILMSEYTKIVPDWRSSCDGYFGKPFHFPKLAEKIDKLLIRGR